MEELLHGARKLTQASLPTKSAAIAPIHVIAGPTAIGKSAIGLKLAQILNGEIISADSRQIYKELSIGTAKPSSHELANIPHHFIDELSLGEPYSAGLFAEQASKRINKIFENGRTPIVVGGSTLYLHALVHGLSPVPSSNPTVRADIEERLIKIGKNALYQELCKVDPQSAKTMDPSKTARVVRALEVYEIAGTPLSELQRKPAPPQHKYCVTVLTLDRPTLYQRIENRVDYMLEDGLIDEVRRIRTLNIDPTFPALKSIGYQEPLSYLDGLSTWNHMVELIKRNSRRYAKRQMTWFRRYQSYQNVNIHQSLEDTIDNILSKSNNY
ncbi:MAG: tRNA (adenosine(37)-N6)-dimethylallyltransferase MiaA [Bacteroidetes bacterium]|nr:tRNA (adenosine(37)-N6)-dimethylallyltransferase MiaA [Bacteroidota bacterium]MCY4204163.1 tRNA (adenosine(37)-N6)-dimethylallyltransferase MiaA [Bacteroidota bacterium]